MDTDDLQKKAGVRVFDFSGGRPMKGWLLVGPEATATAEGFKEWIDDAIAYMPTIPMSGKRRQL